jgi:hypothetical protein
MTPGEIGMLIGVILSFVLGAISLAWQAYREKRQMPYDIDSKRAQTSETLAKALETMTQRYNEMAANNDLMEKRIDAQERQIALLKADSENREREYLQTVSDLKDWAERLSHQVYALGGTPVNIRERKAT